MCEGKAVSTIFLKNLQFLQKLVHDYLPGKVIDQFFKEPILSFFLKKIFLIWEQVYENILHVLERRDFGWHYRYL